MKIFIVLAHPEPQSLTHSLNRVLVEELIKGGHEIKLSDLYEMEFNGILSARDAPVEKRDGRFHIAHDQRIAYENHLLPKDVQQEQEKLNWADIVIFQYPLWWYSVPAILKGWIDRVWAAGYAYGRGNSSNPFSERYGNGIFVGKKAMIFTTAAGNESHYSPRGICGLIDDVLFHQSHGWLFYPGFSVLPPLVLYSAGHVPESDFEKLAEPVRQRARKITTVEPINFRNQNGGDYDLNTLELKPGLEKPGTYGFRLHTK